MKRKSMLDSTPAIITSRQVLEACAAARHVAIGMSVGRALSEIDPMSRWPDTEPMRYLRQLHVDEVVTLLQGGDPAAGYDLVALEVARMLLGDRSFASHLAVCDACNNPHEPCPVGKALIILEEEGS
jgi:hypothetical protein